MSLVIDQSELKKILNVLTNGKGDLSIYIGDIYHCVGLIVKNHQYVLYDPNNTISADTRNDFEQLCQYLYEKHFETVGICRQSI